MNNFDLILPLLTGVWDTYTYPISFHVQIFQRKKDGLDISNNKSVRIIADWFIYSENQFKRIQPAIKSLCQIYDARCYIAINGKTDEMLLWHLHDESSKRLKNKQIHANGLYSSVHDTCNGHGSKRWIVDVDNPEVDIIQLCDDINSCRSGSSKNVIMVIPTKNGHHIITNPFDLSQIQLPEKVEVKKNNSTLLYWV